MVASSRSRLRLFFSFLSSFFSFTFSDVLDALISEVAACDVGERTVPVFFPSFSVS